MARILLGPMVADARGKEGGIVFSRNAAGHYIRAKVSPVQPRTPAQLTVREAVTYCSQVWRDVLTPTLRLAWDKYASSTPLTNCFSHNYTTSGLAMFLRYNTLLRRLSLALLTAAPSIGGQAGSPFGALTGTDAAGVKITSLNLTLTGSDLVTVSLCAAPMSQARNYYSGPWQHKTCLDPTTTYPFTIVASDLTTIGQRWFVRLRMFAKNGMVGPPWQGQVDILA